MQAPWQPAAKPTVWPFDGPSVLAPMEGVSHPLFREIMLEGGGLDLVCTEFVRITGSPISAKQLRGEVVVHDRCPLSVQVMGNDAERMAEAAEILCQAGAAVVDINLGCPMPRVVRKGVGSAMLKQPKLLTQVLRRMRDATKGLLSAKIRAGFGDAEDRGNPTADAVTIAKIVEDAGADFITVHPRRRADFYSGVADWRIIKRLKQVLSIPVVGNGDVWYAADAIRMMSETGCDAVMIGRPALRNPWIFRQIRELRSGEQPFRPDGPALLGHLQRVEARYREGMGNRRRGIIGPLKELLTWIGRSVGDDRRFLREVLRLQSVSEIMEYCEQRLPPLGAESLDLAAEGELQLERSGSAVVSTRAQVPAAAAFDQMLEHPVTTQ